MRGDPAVGLVRHCVGRIVLKGYTQIDCKFIENSESETIHKNATGPESDAEYFQESQEDSDSDNQRTLIWSVK